MQMHIHVPFREEHVFVLAHMGGHISHEVIPIVSEQTYGLRGSWQEVVQPHDTLATDSILRAQTSTAAAAVDQWMAFINITMSLLAVLTLSQCTDS